MILRDAEDYATAIIRGLGVQRVVGVTYAFATVARQHVIVRSLLVNPVRRPGGGAPSAFDFVGPRTKVGYVADDAGVLLSGL